MNTEDVLAVNVLPSGGFVFEGFPIVVMVDAVDFAFGGGGPEGVAGEAANGDVWFCMLMYM